MTKRQNEQKDLGEPAFSPDGRYLYYSQDVTPGRIFQYNKDPNDEIYAIQRLDRVTGRTDRFVSAPGGSIRPTPSPDGKRLAFVRRQRGKTVLFVKDLSSGHERAVFDGLERDMQETWAIHGVYPAMAWTPDNRAIVLWAAGKIRRVDVESGSATVIPFHVAGTRKMAEAVRFPVDVAPARFPVRMLRWVEVSSRGDQVAYEALGHIWVRDLPAGTPRRLTSQTDHFELYPSFSRDGRWIVFTTWDDEKAGSVRVAPARGGEEKSLTAEPGHYREPVFSPDGTRVVYRKDVGGFLVTTDWGLEPGIYWVPAARRQALARDARRCGAAVRRGQRPRLLHALRRRRRQGGGEAHLRERRSGRRRSARASPERRRDRVSHLARREVDRLPRALQRLHRALRSDRGAGGHRPEVEGDPGRARLEGRRRVSALVGRREEPPLVARPRALHAEPDRLLRVPRRGAGEAAGRSGERDGHRVRGGGGHAPTERSRSSAAAS